MEEHLKRNLAMAPEKDYVVCKIEKGKDTCQVVGTAFAKMISRVNYWFPVLH